jgi:hypothetical protein
MQEIATEKSTADLRRGTPASAIAAGESDAVRHQNKGGSCTSERLTVRLHKILRAPWAIPPVDSYRVIGTVHRGMEFGFLAISREGSYLQVNGSVVQRLNRCDVDAAINIAEHLSTARPVQVANLGPISSPAMAAASSAGPVTVIRKKRRTPADTGIAP